MRWRWPIHIHLSTLFVVVFVLSALVIGVQRYRSTTATMIGHAQDRISSASREAGLELARGIESASLAANMLSRSSLPPPQSQQSVTELLPLLKQALRSSEALEAVFVGYGSGDMFLVRRLRNEGQLKLFEAPEGTRYILQTINRAAVPAQGHFSFMDEELNSLREEERPAHAQGYDPRSRGWYREAFRAGQTVAGKPYVFFTTKQVGLTISTPVENSRTVVGADVSVESLGAMLKQLRITPGSYMALVLPDGQLLAHSDAASAVYTAQPDGGFRLLTLAQLPLPFAARLDAKLQASAQDEPQQSVEDMGGQLWHTAITGVKAPGGLDLRLIIAVPDQELMADAHAQRRQEIVWNAVAVVLAALLVVWLSRRIARPIRHVAEVARKIQRFDFSAQSRSNTIIREVHELEETIDSMKLTIRRFLNLSETVSSEQNFDKLLQLLLSETCAAVKAEGGVLYLADHGQLRPGAVLLPGQDLSPQALPAFALTEDSLPGAALSALQTVQRPLDPASRQALGLPAAHAASGPGHALAVPLVTRKGEPVGCLLLLGQAAFDAGPITFVRALSGTAASTLETRELIHSQKELFEAFIRLIAGAIDSKSPYTGGHCERVPELTKMLARAACEQTEGRWRDFDLDENGWEAVHVAAWLHDCGKITTPEFVVDKATKLECIYDRIHEVRMRFEVLKRDAQIQALREQMAGQDAGTVQQRLRDELAQLDADFAFVCVCNEGGEFMAPEKVERLRAIAARTWLRTLDDRMGISSEELQRKNRSAAPPLPVEEALLADKPEHRVERGPEAVDPFAGLGIQMAKPALLYDKGELHNLSISRGTLTEEDRYKINEHIIQTIRMLANLPFPKHLREVPEIAGGHHEKMDGTGYPKRLQGSQMSPVARMMAIADIFEALTASDRPYKKAKTLSESLRIMKFMVKDQHIDPDLFELFLRSGVWQDYAQKYLKPDQIDAVRIEDYLPPPPAESPVAA